jgi:hypothetical protein
MEIMEGDFRKGDLVSCYSAFPGMEVPCTVIEYVQWMNIEFGCSIRSARNSAKPSGRA